MICCRDMTFCPFWRTCAKADGCHRPLTPEVKQEAIRICRGADVLGES